MNKILNQESFTFTVGKLGELHVNIYRDNNLRHIFRCWNGCEFFIQMILVNTEFPELDSYWGTGTLDRVSFIITASGGDIGFYCQHICQSEYY